jgi:hypothetical protein
MKLEDSIYKFAGDSLWGAARCRTSICITNQTINAVVNSVYRGVYTAISLSSYFAINEHMRHYEH